MAAHVDDLVRIGAGIATSAWLQLLLCIVHDDFGSAALFGFINGGVQYFALAAMIGVPFEMRRRRRRN